MQYMVDGTASDGRVTGRVQVWDADRVQVGAGRFQAYRAGILR